jgi:hypothetical protein
VRRLESIIGYLLVVVAAHACDRWRPALKPLRQIQESWALFRCITDQASSAPAVVAGVSDPNFKARLLTLGIDAEPRPRAFGQFIADEIPRRAKVIKLANIKPE